MHATGGDQFLAGVLGALADPMRLRMMKRLVSEKNLHTCTDATPCPKMAKSTPSNHFPILREAGLIRTVKQGVEQ